MAVQVLLENTVPAIRAYFVNIRRDIHFFLVNFRQRFGHEIISALFAGDHLRGFVPALEFPRGAVIYEADALRGTYK